MVVREQSNPNQDPVADKYSEYWAFGADADITVQTGQPFKYTGQPFDNEGGLGLYYYGARYYDPVLGRFMAVDPAADKYPGLSPYVYCANNPLKFVDPDGRLQIPASQQRQYPRLTAYIKDNIKDVANNPKIANALKTNGEFTDQSLRVALTWGQGPTINVTQLQGANGSFTPNCGSTTLNISTPIVQQLEGASAPDLGAALLLVGSTVLHELTHFGDDADGVDRPGEEGTQFEIDAYGQDIDDMSDARTQINNVQARQQQQQQQQQP